MLSHFTPVPLQERINDNWMMGDNFRALKNSVQMQITYNGMVPVEPLTLFPELERSAALVAKSAQFLAQSQLNQVKSQDPHTELTDDFQKRGWSVALPYYKVLISRPMSSQINHTYDPGSKNCCRCWWIPGKIRLPSPVFKDLPGTMLW